MRVTTVWQKMLYKMSKQFIMSSDIFHADCYLVRLGLMSNYFLWHFDLPILDSTFCRIKRYHIMFKNVYKYQRNLTLLKSILWCCLIPCIEQYYFGPQVSPSQVLRNHTCLLLSLYSVSNWWSVFEYLRASSL